MTLPQDTIEYLQTIDGDLGWAIVKLASTARGSPDVDAAVSAPPPDVSLVPIGPRQFLMVVRVHEAFTTLPDVDLIPLGHGQAFLAFRRHRSVESLELSLLDRLEDQTLGEAERTRFAAFRDVLRSWRLDHAVTFHERAIVIVERRAERRRPRPSSD